MDNYDIPIEIKKKFNKVIHELEEVIDETEIYFGYDDEDLKYISQYQYILEYLSFHYLNLS